MEDTLRVRRTNILKLWRCLNPCFNGRYSQSEPEDIRIVQNQCLNPCFNGRYSQRAQRTSNKDISLS